MAEVRRSRQRRLLSALRVLRSAYESEGRALRSSLEATRLLLDASERDRASRIGEIRQLLRSHRAEVDSYEETLRVVKRGADDLQRKVAYLSTASGALRVFLGLALQAMGLYETLRRRRESLEGLVPLAEPPRPDPGEAPGPSASSSPGEARPSLLDAFVVARSLEGDTPDLALERLYHLGSRLKGVLCVGGSPRGAQGAYMLASGGTDVVVVGANGILDRLPVAGLTVSPEGLGDWLLARQGLLRGLDGVLLGDTDSGEDARLLHGRLPPECTLIVQGPGRIPDADVSGTEHVEGLTVTCPPPPPWRDPADADPGYYARKPWLSGPRQKARLPSALPSGRAWPRISVVTATLNQGAFLEETLRSVLGQDYPDLEYIVIDGGSTDETPAILGRYRDRLAHCVSGPDEGQADALNKGFALATGSILAWLNSDDRYPAGALWRAALAFDTFGADMVVGGCALVHDQADEPVRVHHPALPVGRLLSLPLSRLLDVEGSWTRGDFFYQPEVFWTREIWQAAGGRVAKDLYYSMDYELWLRLAGCGARVVHLPDTLAVYRMHKAQKTDGAGLPYLPELQQVASRYRAARAG